MCEFCSACILLIVEQGHGIMCGANSITSLAILYMHGVCLCMNVCIYEYVCMYACKCICVYVCRNICMLACVCACMYLCV